MPIMRCTGRRFVEIGRATIERLAGQRQGPARSVGSALHLRSTLNTRVTSVEARHRRPMAVLTRLVAAVALVAGCTESDVGNTGVTPGAAAQNAGTASPFPGNERPPTRPTVGSGEFSLAETEVSEFPVGREWLERIPAIQEIDVLSELAYNEWQRRIAACMASHGFAYNPGVYWDELRVERDRAANPLNENAATVFGYHAPPVPEPPAAIGGGGGEEYDLALGGSEDGATPGCAAASMADAYEMVEPIGQQVQALLAQGPSGTSFSATPAGTELLDDWSSCMSGRGYEYQSPLQPLQHFSGADTVTDEELAVRATDLACDRDVGLTAERSAWERAAR